MDSTATKRQAIDEQTMATTENSYFLTELQNRREKLATVRHATASEASLQELIHNVDEAIARLEKGTFGICEECNESIERERLICDPLLRFCLDHLSQQEQRALESDLVLAAQIQRALLPCADWSREGWRARYHYQPAGMVSGDYCDLIEADGTFLFLVGDVAGKGVAASMLMSHLHATFRSLVGRNLSLRELVQHANRLFSESTTAGQYATLVVGRAWPDGRVEYVSAGHLPLLHVSSTGVSSRRATGVPLGMFCTTDFPVCELWLAPGDTLFMYTDGLTESFNKAGDEYGTRRVEELARRHAQTELEQMLASCLKEMHDFSGGAKQMDDLTLLALRRV
jgi:sigma-B regulation protein RsbU (phosphoserine phosphatase)